MDTQHERLFRIRSSRLSKVRCACKTVFQNRLEKNRLQMSFFLTSALGSNHPAYDTAVFSIYLYGYIIFIIQFVIIFMIVNLINNENIPDRFSVPCPVDLSIINVVWGIISLFKPVRRYFLRFIFSNFYRTRIKIGI